MKNQAKQVHIVPIADLNPNPRNRNVHSKEQIDRLCEIIKYQGFRQPLVVSNRSRLVVAGHGRLEAAKFLNMAEVPVIYQDFESEDQEYAFGVSDNAIASWAELDLSGINTDIGELGPDFDIDLLGIENFVLEPAEKFEAQCDEDEVLGDVDTRCKPGDVWLLGRHRLMCGDSTNIQHVEELMDGELADLWLTDPPYGVAYQSAGRRGKENQHDEIENDSKPLAEMKDFWQQVAANAFLVCSDKAAYYWFACQGGDQMMMMMMMSLGDGGWQVKHELIWLKDQMVFGRADYHYKHEPIIYGWKRGGTHDWCADRKQVSVLEFPRPKKSEEHPTMKPVELVQYLMGNNTKQGQLVLETFGGSGTTLIAAEKIGRRCNAIEVSPKYCDVILSRWEKYTGKTAERVNG